MTIERRMARSAAWMIGLRLADRTIGLVSVLFLARLLVPADFGLVAMGTVILGALEAMSAFGFEMALIKRQAKDRARWDSAWTLNVMIGVFNATVIAALAPLAALFYGEPRVTSVMLVLAASALVSGLRNIGMVEFEQELRFGRIVMLSLTRRTVSFVVTLALAWWYGSYWALLVGMVTGHVVDLLLSYAFSPYRPRFSLVAWRDLFSFSKWLLLNNVLFYTSQRGGDAVVGNQAGASALGTYTVSLELANLPTSELVWPVMRAVFPGYAMMSSNVQRLAQGFLKVFALVLMFALPAAAGIALLAEPLVAVLLGPRWSDATPIIQVLAIAGGIRAAQANTGSVYLALDRPHLASAIMFLGILLSLGPFAIAVGRMPLADAAWFFVFSGLATALVNLILLTRLLALRWRTILGALVRPGIGIGAMAAVLLLVRPLLWSAGQPLPAAALALVVLVLIGAATYLATVALAWHVHGRPPESPEQAILETIAPAFRRRSAA
jgi:lipopolysaccharide exporter